MNTKMASGLFALALAFGFSAPTFARAQDTPQDQSAKSKSKGSESVTGCLQKEGDSYTLTADDGTVWHVHSKSVDLGAHVNHTVTVTGMGREKSESKTTANDEGETKSKSKEMHRLHVSKLEMVSESCQK